MGIATIRIINQIHLIKILYHCVMKLIWPQIAIGFFENMSENVDGQQMATDTVSSAQLWAFLRKFTF